MGSLTLLLDLPACPANMTLVTLAGENLMNPRGQICHEQVQEVM